MIARAHDLLRRDGDASWRERPFLAGRRATLADIANYSYIAHAPEGNVSLEPYPQVRAWLARIEALPGFVPMVAIAASGWPHERADAVASTWHEGERALQARAGVRERMAEIGPRVMRDYMPEQHRSFFAQLPFLVAGSLDAAGQPWASVLAGAARLRALARRAPPARRCAAAGRRSARAPRCGPARRSGCSASSRTRGGATA